MPELVEHLLLAVDEDDLGEREQHGRQCGAGQHDPHRAGAAAEIAQHIDDDAGQPRSEQAEAHIGGDAGRAEKGDGGGHGGRCAGIDAEQARIGERIARQSLHDSAGHPQPRAGDHGQQRARNAQVHHHQVLAIARIEGSDSFPGQAERGGLRAHDDADRNKRQEQKAKQDQPRHALSGDTAGRPHDEGDGNWLVLNHEAETARRKDRRAGRLDYLAKFSTTPSTISVAL